MFFSLLLINVMILSNVFIDLNFFFQVSDVAHGPLVKHVSSDSICKHYLILFDAEIYIYL